jgi:hypothetical protein
MEERYRYNSSKLASHGYARNSNQGKVICTIRIAPLSLKLRTGLDMKDTDTAS